MIKTLQKNSCIAIVSPASQGHLWLEEKYHIAQQNLQNLGFQTKTFLSNHLKPSAQERADLLMQAYCDDSVEMIICTIGGLTSGSLLPFLDFELIKKNEKLICGMSDITALLSAFYCHGISGLLYGPNLITGFGEPTMPSTCGLDSFLSHITPSETLLPVQLSPTTYWTNEFVDATQSGWQSQKKNFMQNSGWKPYADGVAEGKVFAANQNTLLTLAGTPFFPDLTDHILILEQMQTDLGLEERQFNQLNLLGIFDKIKGLVISKIETAKGDYTTDKHAAILANFIDFNRGFPVVFEFDCGHIIPTLTVSQGCRMRLAVSNGSVQLSQLNETLVTS